MTLKSFLALLLLSCALIASATEIAVTPAAAPVPDAVPDGLDNAGCLHCHDGKQGKHKIAVAGADGATRTLRPVRADKLAQSVHARMACVQCHTDIVDSQAKHQKAAGVVLPDCPSCHTRLWDEAKANADPATWGRLGIVADNIAAYRNSFHARPDADHPQRPKAFCEDCHPSHEFAVPLRGTPAREQWRLGIAAICGSQCHEDQLEEYQGSVHGKLTEDQHDPKGAVCIDCHTTHEIRGTSSDPFKLRNVEACGNCHRPELASYRNTYHGQVNELGYTYTAKCSDCHGGHGITKIDDPDSKVSPRNRLKTCRQCHNLKKPGMILATERFVTFGPHANGHDFKRYPRMWITTRVMGALLIGVFAFFWLHSALWYYREQQEAKAGKSSPRILTADLDPAPEKHFQRFPWGWRAAHLAFACITMTLVLTGTAALFSGSDWAPVIAHLVGGPKILAIIHHTAAAVFIGLFVTHLIYVVQHLLRDRSFRWFGPDSLLPNRKDVADCIGMFKWFFGKGPRPLFDRWTYFEKFDYWAVFWGVTIIGISGLIMGFPHFTAAYLPGWTFNIATLVHGEEAFLAAVFLFTVHFFNNHFRPDKFPPPDVVMFTGTQSLSEFRREHPLQYQRLVERGELEQYLVAAPSGPMHRGSVILGLTLIGCGLTLLTLVVIGFFGA